MGPDHTVPLNMDSFKNGITRVERSNQLPYNSMICIDCQEQPKNFVINLKIVHITSLRADWLGLLRYELATFLFLFELPRIFNTVHPCTPRSSIAFLKQLTYPQGYFLCNYEIPQILWKLGFNYRVHKSICPSPESNQSNACLSVLFF